MMKIKKLGRGMSSWTLLSSLVIIAIVLPNLNIVVQAIKPTNDNWQHIKDYLLNQYVTNTLILVISIGLITAFLGVLTAWIITMFEFPGRKFLSWAFILPIAIPPYIGAYTYHGMLNYTGWIQSTLRNIFSIEVTQKYFSIMNMRGAIFIFVIFLYPYVYMTTRSYLRQMSSSIIESSRMLGHSFFSVFFQVVLPLSRVAIIGGSSLVVLEVINDYGVVKYFGVPVFSTAIYSTWFGMGDIDSAIQLASRLMIIVLVVILLEKLFQGRKVYSNTTSKIKPIKRYPLHGIKKIGAAFLGFVIVSLGFFIPLIQLIKWTTLVINKVFNTDFIEMTVNSLGIATIASLLIVVSGIIVANFSRVNKSFIGKMYAKVTVIGYSIPASVIALGVMMSFLFVDRNLYPLYQIIDPSSKKLLLSTSLLLLLAAYFIRFLAIGFNPIEAAFEKIGKGYFESSRLLGRNVTQTFFAIDFPMIRSSIFAALILVFVDVLKELPLTLILRPFNFNTLATRAFEYANDEMIYEASVASLIIILISVISIYILNRLGDKEEKKWQ